MIGSRSQIIGVFCISELVESYSKIDSICIRMMKKVIQTCKSNVSKFFSITRDTIVNLYLIFELIT